MWSRALALTLFKELDLPIQVKMASHWDISCLWHDKKGGKKCHHQTCIPSPIHEPVGKIAVNPQGKVKTRKGVRQGGFTWKYLTAILRNAVPETQNPCEGRHPPFQENIGSYLVANGKLRKLPVFCHLLVIGKAATMSEMCTDSNSGPTTGIILELEKEKCGMGEIQGRWNPVRARR